MVSPAGRRGSRLPDGFLPAASTNAAKPSAVRQVNPAQAGVGVMSRFGLGGLREGRRLVDRRRRPGNAGKSAATAVAGRRRRSFTRLPAPVAALLDLEWCARRCPQSRRSPAGLSPQLPARLPRPLSLVRGLAVQGVPSAVAAHLNGLRSCLAHRLKRTRWDRGEPLVRPRAATAARSQPAVRTTCAARRQRQRVAARMRNALGGHPVTTAVVYTRVITSALARLPSSRHSARRSAIRPGTRSHSGPSMTVGLLLKMEARGHKTTTQSRATTPNAMTPVTVRTGKTGVGPIPASSWPTGEWPSTAQ
jgi:hypothetical protein